MHCERETHLAMLRPMSPWARMADVPRAIQDKLAAIAGVPVSFQQYFGEPSGDVWAGPSQEFRFTYRAIRTDGSELHVVIEGWEDTLSGQTDTWRVNVNGARPHERAALESCLRPEPYAVLLSNTARPTIVFAP